jgi:hypothetical protein
VALPIAPDGGGGVETLEYRRQQDEKRLKITLTLVDSRKDAAEIMEEEA